MENSEQLSRQVRLSIVPGTSRLSVGEQKLSATDGARASREFFSHILD